MNTRVPKEDSMYRRIFLLTIILIVAFATVIPVQAISYGEPDGTAHPSVGSIVLRVSENKLYQMCTGTLISSKVFLTAAHCTAPLDGIVADNPGSEVLVTFDPVIAADGTFYTGTWHTNPAYNNYAGQSGNSDPGDIAVIVLDKEPGGIAPASLPTAGLLDDLKARHVLYTTGFTAVGYGSVRDIKETGWQAVHDNLDRNRADQEALSLTKAWITLSMNSATGNGGTCYGDSGGPHFMYLDGKETDIVAAITVTGDAQCKATDKDYRTDTGSARRFLASYVTLP
jgi:hypothetical protein